MTPLPRLALLCDLLEENWQSMNLVAEMLFLQLRDGFASEVRAARIDPALSRRFSRLPLLGRKRAALNADILLTRLWDYPRLVRRRAGDFDLLHVCDHSYAHLVHELPAARTGVYCHDLHAFRCLFEPDHEPRPRWFRSVQRHVLDGLKKAAVVFYSTADVRRRIDDLGLIDPDRLVHAPYGISPEYTPGPDAADAAEAAALGLGGRPYLLHVGVCTTRKRIDVLLDVFALARKRYPDLRLAQIGGPWTPEQCEQIDRLGVAADVVQVRGLERRTIAALYRRAAMLLQPSEAEGFGLPVIEALACGATVVASDLPILREVGGDAAVYCPVADVPRWAEAVVRLLDDPAAAPEPSCRLAQARRFSWASHARTVLGAYQRLL